jgi:hypothetical protein
MRYPLRNDRAVALDLYYPSFAQAG